MTRTSSSLWATVLVAVAAGCAVPASAACDAALPPPDATPLVDAHALRRDATSDDAASDDAAPADAGPDAVPPPRVFLAVGETAGMQELFVETASGVSRISGPLQDAGDVIGFVVSADARRVLYLADAQSDNMFELWGVSIEGGPVVRVSHRLAFDYDVSPGMRISPDGTRVVYRAGRTAIGVFELFSAPIGGGIATRISGPNTLGGAVEPGFWISCDGATVYYRADAFVDETFEWFSVGITGGEVHVFSAGEAPTADGSC